MRVRMRRSVEGQGHREEPFALARAPRRAALRRAARLFRFDGEDKAAELMALQQAACAAAPAPSLPLPPPHCNPALTPNCVLAQ